MAFVFYNLPRTTRGVSNAGALINTSAAPDRPPIHRNGVASATTKVGIIRIFAMNLEKKTLRKKVLR